MKSDEVGREYQDGEKLEDRISEVFKVLQKVMEDVDDREIKSKVAYILRERENPYYCIVIGEVKAGKSSFINGFLRENVCHVETIPCTNIIHEIRNGDVAESTEISAEYIRHVICNGRLENFSVLDTPGMGTIAFDQQSLLEKYIPEGDLLIVVFSALNVYQNTVWEQLRQIREMWNKRCIFVIQQKDMVEPESLKRSVENVRNLAIRIGIPDPKIFAVSAKEELEGRTETSGYEQFREYIKQNITGTKRALQKQVTGLQMSKGVIRTVENSLELRCRQNAVDQVISQKITEQMKLFREKSQGVTKDVIDKVLREIDLEVEQYRKDVINILNPKKIKERFQTKSQFEEWLLAENQKASGMLQKKVERRVLHAIKSFYWEAEEVLTEVCKCLESREEILSAEDQLYGSIEKRKRAVSLTVRDTNVVVSGTNRSLTNLSEDLFSQILAERDKYDMKVNATTAVAGAGAAVGTVAATVATKGAIGTALAGKASVGVTTALFGPLAPVVTPFIVAAGVVCVAVAGIIASVKTTELTYEISKKIYERGLFKKVDQYILEYNQCIAENAEQMKEKVKETLLQQFGDEIKRLEDTFEQWSIFIREESDMLPQLTQQVRYLEQESRQLLVEMVGGNDYAMGYVKEKEYEI